ncbi:MAG TPA: amidohydrolase family protein [Burkholderiales bacterium]
MQGKIGLEEHFAIPETLNDSRGYLGDNVWPELEKRLMDIQEYRLRQMDAHGMQMMILSLNAPAVQAIFDPKKAIDIARRANDFLAGEVKKRPERFQGFAALAMQDPEAATRELIRCVKELGFRGALVNGFSQVKEANSMVYLDDPRYAGFWAECEKLEVPFYLHPRNPLPSAAQIYEGHPWLLGPTWAFAQETAVHALRLMCSGLFDRHPKLQIVLGHMAEGLPYAIWRCDNRNAWTKNPPRYPAKKKLAEYLQQNFHMTTSGAFRTQTLIDAILEVGADRIMFSTDWPFENVDHAAIWFDAATISEADRMKIGRTNAVKLFKLAL